MAIYLQIHLSFNYCCNRIGFSWLVGLFSLTALVCSLVIRLFSLSIGSVVIAFMTIIWFCSFAAAGGRFFDGIIRVLSGIGPVILLP